MNRNQVEDETDVLWADIDRKFGLSHGEAGEYLSESVQIRPKSYS
jgi:hypothetical protein